VNESVSNDLELRLSIGEGEESFVGYVPNGCGDGVPQGVGVIPEGLEKVGLKLTDEL